ncbi:MAG: YfhO family protein [Gemmatimonadetes bacterium]|nr:YfhO family protein [Gemmatimonadota bacterium]
MRRFGPFLILALILAALYPMDWHPGRALVTYHPDNFVPWADVPGGGVSFNPDCLQSYYPRARFAHEASEQGRIPLWDPYSFAGQPFLANFQSGVFYPVNWALRFLSPEASLGAFYWIHLWIAALGMYFLSRAFGVSPVIAIVAGVVYASNGAIAVRTGQSTMMAVPAWFPFAILAMRNVFAGRSLVPLALVFAMIILAGFPPTLAWGAMLLGALLLALTFGKTDGTSRGTSFARASFALLLGVALAAVQLLPTIEFIMQTDRVRFEAATLLSSAWHPAALIRMLVPDYFGTPFRGNDWLFLLKRGDGHYYQTFISTAAYAGIWFVLFAPLGIRRLGKNVVGRTLLAVGAIALLILLGTPVAYGVAHIPGLGGARLDRVVHLVTLPLVLLGACGLDRFARGRATAKAWAAPAGIAAVSFVALYLIGPRIADWIAGQGASAAVDEATLRAAAVRSFVVLVTGAACLLLSRRYRHVWLAFLAIVILDTALEARDCHVTVPEHELPHVTPAIEYLQNEDWGRLVRFGEDVFPPNLPGLFELEDAAGYNALNVKYYRRYWMAMARPSVKERRINALTALVSVDSPLLDRLGARWILTGPDEDLEFPLRHEGPMRVYENERAYPRAYFATEVRNVESPRAAYAYLSHPLTRRFGTTVEKDTVIVPAAPEGEEGSVVLHSDAPEVVAVQTENAREGMLVLSDTWYPGWRAFVDGEETELYRVSRIFRGVVVPAGEHEVVFRYAPAPFARGRAISLASLGILVLLAVAGGVRARRRQ